jgi:hypothetical protein
MRLLFSLFLFFLFSCGSISQNNSSVDELDPKEMLRKIDSQPLIEEDHC